MRESRNATGGPNVSVPADVEESADDLMGDGIDIAARLRGIAEPSATLRGGPLTGTRLSFTRTAPWDRI
jgi:predicted ester cyclase